MPTYDAANSWSTYGVPAGIQAVRLTVVGGTGADSVSDRGDGGAGGRVVGRLSVAGGDTLTIYVGEDGSVPAGGQSPLGDAGDGGGNAGGGGSVSAVGDNNQTLVAVGAGGGGGGEEGADRGGGGGGSRGGLGGATASSSPGEGAQGSGAGGDGGYGSANAQAPGNGQPGGTITDGGLTAVTETTSTAGPSVTVEPAPTLETVETLDGTSLELSWTASSNVDIYRSTASGGLDRSDYTELATNVSGSSFTDGALLNGERYYYRLAATGGGTPLSNEGDATTRLPSPTGLAVDSVEADSIGLSWTATHNNGQTRVEYRPAGTTSWTAGPTVANSTETATASGLRNGEQYELRVVATTEHADSPDASKFDVASGATYTFTKPLDPETMPFDKPLVNAGTVKPDDAP